MNFITNFALPLYKDVKTLVLDTLFPISCLACEQEGKEFLCELCKPKLVRVHQICIICHKPSVGGLTHPNCKKLYSPDGLISLLDYHDKRVSKLIIHGKYHFVKDIYLILGKMLVDEIKTKHPHLADKSARYTFVPIPLYWMRKNWRGFNQADILCKTLANDLQLLCTSVLVRCRSTKTQKDLKKEERKENVKDVFTLLPLPLGEGRLARRSLGEGGGEGAQIKPLQNQNFILVDDVATTGATLLEAVKILKQNGAKSVWCLTVAKD